MLDEVRQGPRLVEGSLLDVVPRVYRKLEAGLRDASTPSRDWRVPPFLRFGSWIGGDRDGHPSVTHDVTAEAIRLQQETLLRHYLERIDDLWRRLSHSDRFVTAGRGPARLAREGRRALPRGRPPRPATSRTGRSAG